MQPFQPWAREVAKRRGHHKAVLAIANKMARIGWVPVNFGFQTVSLRLLRGHFLTHDIH